jgi:hypothetical protein
MQVGVLEALYTYSTYVHGDPVGHSATRSAREDLGWIEAQPAQTEYSSLYDLFRDVLSGSYRKRRRFQMAAYRCPSCGCLEFYAR